MQPNAKSHQPENNNTLRPETVRELVQRHMKDEAHKTTEEELRNATLELPETANVKADDAVIRKDIAASADNDDKDEKDIILTPLDTVS